jgi:hypothetical protein
MHIKLINLIVDINICEIQAPYMKVQPTNILTKGFIFITIDIQITHKLLY